MHRSNCYKAAADRSGLVQAHSGKGVVPVHRYDSCDAAVDYIKVVVC